MKKRFSTPFIISLLGFLTVEAQQSVLTQHYSNERLGANTKETFLTTSNVTKNTFGKLRAYPADGQIYAQPLVISNLSIPGKGIRNVLFVVTMHNTVYAYDADSLTTPFWSASLGPSCTLPDANVGYRYGPYSDIKIEIGIVSTPVIDSSSNTIFIVAFSRESGKYYHRLHALDIRTGAAKVGSPTTIQASLPGTGDGNVNGIVSFDSQFHLQRSSLLLLNGVVYFAFASYADTNPYHGWVLGYDAKTLALKYTFNDSPNGEEGGIWMSGQGPSVDKDGNIYLITGNGSFTANKGGKEYGDSYIKLKPNGTTLEVVDYFTPYNQAQLAAQDTDLGVDGPILIPNTNYVVGGSKEGKLYVVDKTNMGKFNTSSCKCDNQIVQTIQAFNGHLHGSLVYWEGPNGKNIYGWSEDDYMKSFRLEANGLFTATPSMQSPTKSPAGMPGGVLCISSNGNKAGSGILWANIPFSGDAQKYTVNGILRAFDASDLSKEIWNSYQNIKNDSCGYFAKFNSPVVVNGKVYLPTFSGQVIVYGLLHSIVTDMAEEPNQEESTTVFPNPFSNTLTIRKKGSFSYSICDMAGNEQERGKGEETLLVGAKLSAGIYLLKIESASGTQSLKVHKTH